MRFLKFQVTRFVPLLAAGFLAGCSDPSEGVHKSTATTPQPPTASAAVAGAPAANAGQPYVIRSESKIGFVGSKVTGSHHGGFTNFAGTLQVSNGKIIGSPQVKIAMQSTWSDNDRLTGHLKNADFFDVEKFPYSTFTATQILGAGADSKVTGNLELHGVTKSISFPAQIQISDSQLTLRAEFAINRRDFNINYPGRPNDLIRDNVVLTLDITATPGPARPQDQLAL